MPTAVISFGNQQATGDSPLAGAPGVAYNVVSDGAGAIRRRPGIVAWDGFPGISGYESSANFSGFTDIKVRGIASFQGKPFWFAGYTELDTFAQHYFDAWSLTDGGAIDVMFGANLPVASATARPTFAETQFRIVATAGGTPGNGSGILWDGTAGTVSYWPDSPANLFATQIVALAQRILANDTTSASTLNRVLYSGVGSTGNRSFGTLSFVSAEARPDAVVALRENSNELFVFGERTLQVFVPDPQTVLAPQRTINRGCSAAHSVIRANENFGWLDDERQIVVSDGRDIDEVSTPIAGTLDAMSTVDDCYGFRVNADQFDLMTWQFPTDGRTFCYQRGGGWSQWSTQTDTNEHGPFPITSHYYWPEENLHLVGQEDGSIAQLSTDAYTDLGDPIVAEVTTGFYNHGTDAVKFTDALHLTFKRGHATGSTEPRVFLSWRDAQGAPFSPPMRIGLGTTGDYVSTVTLRTLGPYRRRQWKLTFSDDTEFVLASVTEDFSIGSS